MKRPSFLLLLAAAISLPSLAQPLQQQWIRTFQAQGKGADRIAAIQVDAMGNVYAAGYAAGHHNTPDAFLMKRNAQGDTLWTYAYDGGQNRDDYITALVLDNQGNAYITGHSQGATYSFDCFTAKISSNGSPAWVARYAAGGINQSYGNALAVDAAGNVYVAGYIDPSSASNDWLVIKYNAAGIQQWVDVLNGPINGDDAALAITISPNGNPTVVGYLQASAANGGINLHVKQYTPANTTVWTDTWTNPNFTGTDKAYGLGFLSNGDLMVGGETRNSTSSNQDAVAIRYDTAGNRQWVSIYADATTAMDEYLRQVIVSPLGDVLFTGTDYQDGYVTCIRNNGTMGWRRKWKGTVPNGYDVFLGITADDNGHVYTTGRGVYPGPDYYGNNGLPNMVITKYSMNGDSLWTYRCHDSLSSSMGFAITYRNGKIYAGGFVTDTAYVDEDLYTLIVDTSGAAIDEWTYNGRGDAIATGQIVLADSSYHVYVGAMVDRLHGQGTDIMLIKYDHAGNLLWEKYFSSGGFHNDTLTAMQFDPSGNLVLCVSSDVDLLKNNYRLSLLRVDPNGNPLQWSWYNSQGSLLASMMDIHTNGNIAVAANSNIQGGMVISFDNNLSTAWAARIDSSVSSVSRVNSLVFFANGDIALGGHSTLAGVSAGLVQRFDPMGNRLWSASIDSLGAIDEIRDVTVNASDEIAFTGRSGNTTMLGTVDGTTGNVLWRRIYNPATSSEYGLKIRYTPAGNLALICRGWTGYVARYYTAQYSATGVFQWGNVYSQTASDREPRHLLVEPNNRVVTAGWAINGTTINYDYILVGYEANGSLAFNNTHSSVTSGGWDQLRSLTRDAFGNLIVSGQTANEFYNNWLYKTLTIKYGDFYVGSEAVAPPMQASARVFPNPSPDGRFTLLDASPYPIERCQVFDMQGRLIQRIKGDCQQIDLHATQPGVYLLILERSHGIADRIMLIVR